MHRCQPLRRCNIRLLTFVTYLKALDTVKDPPFLFVLLMTGPGATVRRQASADVTIRSRSYVENALETVSVSASTGGVTVLLNPGGRQCRNAHSYQRTQLEQFALARFT